MLNMEGNKLRYLICIIYFSGLIYVVFLSEFRWVKQIPLNSRLHIIPLYSKYRFLKDTHLTWEVCLFYLEMIGNILMFFPFPFCLKLVTNYIKHIHIVIFGIAISLAIECVQFIFGIGVADIDDLILNTLGILVGLLFIKFIKKYGYECTYASSLKGP